MCLRDQPPINFRRILNELVRWINFVVSHCRNNNAKFIRETVYLCYDTSKLHSPSPDSNSYSIYYAINLVQTRLSSLKVFVPFPPPPVTPVRVNGWFIHKIERSNKLCRSTVSFRLKKKIFDRRVPTFPLKFQFKELNWDWNLNFEYRAFFSPVHRWFGK